MPKKKIIKRGLLITAIVLVIINIIAFNHAWSFTHYSREVTQQLQYETVGLQDKIVYGIKGVDNPRPENKKTPDVTYETILIQSNVQLECWMTKADSAKGTVLMFHGYKGDKSRLLERAYIINELGYNTLLVDMMGTGGSEGNDVTIGFKEAVNVRDCYQYIEQTGEKNIILFGTSMGAAALMKAIKDYHLEPACNIIEAPFSTLYKTVCNRFDLVGAPYFPMAHLLLVWGGWQHGFWAFDHNPADYAKHITSPTLLIYGAKDNRVMPDETQTIYSNLAGEKTLSIYPEAGHVRYLKHYKKEWTSDIRTFLSVHAGEQ